MKRFDVKMLRLFREFERWITLIVSVIIGIIIIVAVIRTLAFFYHLFVMDFFEPIEITFADYQQIFGKILTLLISLEFMNSILKVLKTHSLRVIVSDVILIAALAIARKLIILDYSKAESDKLLAFGGLMIMLGVFYVLIKPNGFFTRPRGSKGGKDDHDDDD